MAHTVVNRTAAPGLWSGAFTLVWGATLAYFVAIGALLPTLPLFVATNLGGGPAEVGWAVGAFAFAALLLRPVAGRIGDARGRRVLVVAGAGIVALSAAGYALAGSLLPLIALRLVTGAGEALFFVGAAAAVGDLAPEDRRGQALSLFSLALYGGVAAGPLLGEAVLEAGGFAAVWAAVALSALAAAVVGSLLPDTRPAGATSRRAGRLRLHPAGLLPGAVLLATIWGLAGFNAFLPARALEAGLGGSKYLFATFGIVVVSFRSLGARIPDRLGARLCARLALALCVLGLSLIGLAAGPAGLGAGTVVFGLGTAFAFPALMSVAVRSAPPSERASAVATVTAGIDLAFGAGPVALGLAAGALGTGGAFVTAAAVALAGLALSFRLPGRQGE